MKIYKKEIAHSGGGSKFKYRLLLALGKSELEMLVGILTKAYQYFPDTVRYTKENNRLQSMVKVGNRALRDWDSMEIEK
ncbi:MAG: hypothetical protein V3W20_08320 [Candidatus Neomarinimicrobiota bacterium]